MMSDTGSEYFMKNRVRAEIFREDTYMFLNIVITVYIYL